MTKIFLPLVSSILLFSAPAFSHDVEKKIDTNTSPIYQFLEDMFAKTTPSIDARYRYEHVEQSGFAHDADASTLRTRIGLQTATVWDINGKVEFENISPIGNQSYNDTLNGRTQYPTISDPETTALNQLYLAYSGLKDSIFTVGRQNIKLDNERFIGTANFRQNDQTFDAATAVSTFFPDFKFFYGYVSNVNRVVGDESPLGNAHGNIHLFNGSYSGFKAVTITAYNYYLDFDRTFLASSNTSGLRLTGKTSLSGGVDLIYTGEYAHQVDAGPDPRNFGLDYIFFEPGVSYAGFTVKLGYEVLEGNGLDALQTPLATAHGLNGWSDVIGNTPVNGLEDKYLRLSYQFSNVPNIDSLVFTGGYHQYDSTKANMDYGSEWEGKVDVGFGKHYTFGIEYANYQADSFATDTNKLWLTLGAKF